MYHCQKSSPKNPCRCFQNMPSGPNSWGVSYTLSLFLYRDTDNLAGEAFLRIHKQTHHLELKAALALNGRHKLEGVPMKRLKLFCCLLGWRPSTCQSTLSSFAHSSHTSVNNTKLVMPIWLNGRQIFSWARSWTVNVYQIIYQSVVACHQSVLVSRQLKILCLM